jgi:hypothetical protein
MTSNNTPPPATGLGIWANLGTWIAFGLLFGVVVGSLFPGLFGVFVGDLFPGDNVALGAGLGLILGVVVGSVFIARRNARRDS